MDGVELTQKLFQKLQGVSPLENVQCATKQEKKRFLPIFLPIHCYFPSKIFFRMEKIQFSSRRFFLLLLKLPMTRRLSVSAESLVFSIIQVLGVTAALKLEVTGSKPASNHTFNVLSDTRQHNFIL